MVTPLPSLVLPATFPSQQHDHQYLLAIHHTIIAPAGTFMIRILPVSIPIPSPHLGQAGSSFHPIPSSSRNVSI